MSKRKDSNGELKPKEKLKANKTKQKLKAVISFVNIGIYKDTGLLTMEIDFSSNKKNYKLTNPMEVEKDKTVVYNPKINIFIRQLLIITNQPSILNMLCSTCRIVVLNDKIIKIGHITQDYWIDLQHTPDSKTKDESK